MKTGSLPDLTALFRRSPGRPELAALLELLPSAALLVDLQSHEIQSTNVAAQVLTGLPVSRLRQVPLDDILLELTPAAIEKSLRTGPRGWHTPLRSGAGRPRRVQVSMHVLGDTGQFALFTFEGHRTTSVEHEMLAQRFQALPLLANATRQSEFRAAVAQTLQAGQLLTGATTLAFYQIDLDHQRLCRKEQWGLADILPDELSLVDGESMRLPYVWLPGSRPFSDLHRTAQTHTFSYLASIPINPQSPYEGLLVVADQISEPPDHFEAMLDLLAATIATVEHHTRVVHTLESKLQRLTQTMSQTESIEDMVNDGLLFVTPALLITDLNTKAEIMLGYSQDEVHGHPLADVLITSRPIMEEIQVVLTEPIPSDLGNLRLTRRDGKSILVHLRFKPYLVGDTIQRLAIIITDLSREEQFDRRTRQLEQQAQLGELTAILAHEIRNPINNISATLQLMGMSHPADDPIHSRIQRMQKDCDRLEQLMRSVLSFAGSRNYHMIVLDLNLFLQSLIPRWQSRAAASGVEMHLQLPAEPIFITADRVAFEQVFTNLLGNALDAIQSSGGAIGIRVAPSGDSGHSDRVTIDISDTGPGIPPELVDKVFDPFVTTKSRGTGLGLAITQQIVNAHNGHIILDTFPGGTLFKITLPMRTEPQPPE